MAHQIVRLTDEFIAGKSTDFDEFVITIEDSAVQIGGRDIKRTLEGKRLSCWVTGRFCRIGWLLAVA